MPTFKDLLALASVLMLTLTGCVAGTSNPADNPTNNTAVHEAISDSATGPAEDDSGDTAESAPEVDMAVVDQAVMLLTEPELAEDAGRVAAAHAFVEGMTDQEKQVTADRIDALFPVGAAANDAGEPAPPPAADKSQAIPLKWGYSGKLSSSRSTTTSCGGDTDASFYYSGVTNAYSTPSHLKLYESDLVLYGLMRVFFGSTLTGYRITSGNNVYVCVGAGFDSATSAAAVGYELAYNLGLYGY